MSSLRIQGMGNRAIEVFPYEQPLSWAQLHHNPIIYDCIDNILSMTIDNTAVYTVLTPSCREHAQTVDTGCTFPNLNAPGYEAVKATLYFAV